MKKIILVLILWILTLSSCTKEETPELATKKDFYLDIKKAWELDNIAYLKKTWKIDSTQNIVLNSNANGRVKAINVKSGDNVSEWQVLAVLEDNLANYNLNLEVASNNLSATKNNLDMAKNNLEKAKLNYDSTKLKLDKSISDIERNLNNLELTDDTTSSSIELDKIENSINRLNIEYNNLQVSNNETLAWFTRSLDKELQVLSNYLDDVIYFSDEILWVSELNKSKNDDYDKFLWVKNTSQKEETQRKLRELIDYRENTLNKTNVVINSESDYKTYIVLINDTYEKIIDFLNWFDSTLSNTTASIGSISEAQISAYKWTITNYKSLYNSYKSGFLSMSNWIYSFLETYKNTQSSLLKQIENLGKDKNIYLKSLNLNKDTSKATLNEAISNREITLKNLDLVIADAKTAIKDSEIRVRDSEISYRKALNEAEKLFIKSPISWIVWDILVDRWQEIFSWTPSFNILSEWSKEVTISFNKEELDFVNESMKVYYTENSKTFTWTIYSISKNADANLKYLAKVSLPSDASAIWNILNLDIPIILDNKLIPVNAIKVSSLWVWTINYFSTWSTIEQLDLKVWNIYWDEIEVIWEIDNNLDIILNYVDNYDAEKFILKTK